MTGKTISLTRDERITADNATSLILRCVRCQKQDTSYTQNSPFFYGYRPGSRIPTMVCQDCSRGTTHTSAVLFIAAAYRTEEANS